MVEHAQRVLQSVCAAHPDTLSPALKWLVDHGITIRDLLGYGGLVNVLHATEDVTACIQAVNATQVMHESVEVTSSLYRSRA